MQAVARETPMRSMERNVYREVKYKDTYQCEAVKLLSLKTSKTCWTWP